MYDRLMKQTFGICNVIKSLMLNLIHASQAGNVVFQQNTHRSGVYLCGFFLKNMRLFKFLLRKIRTESEFTSGH